MNVWNGKTAGLVRPVANIFILNVLWIIGCLPIITIGPSTAAAMAVLREWKTNGNDSVIRSFFCLFQRHFKQGALVGNGWLLASVVLMADLVFVLHLQTGWKLLFLSLAGSACLLWLLIGTALFPCLVHYEKTGLALLKTSFVLVFSDVQTACAILLFWFAAVLLFLFSPVLTLFTLIFIPFVTIRFSLRSFERLEQQASSRLLHS